jgi:type I site-specific restriction endonuclease
VGLSTVTLIGAAFDLTEEGIAQDFVEEAGAGLETGKAALIAEIDEQWQVPLDTRMEALGGNLLRQTRTQIEDAYAERAVQAAERELAALEAETVAHVQPQADKLQAKIDAAQRKLQAKQSELAAKMQAVEDEGNRKIAVLEAQLATATAESKAVLQERLAEVRSEYSRRTKRLQEAVESRKAAHANVVA